MKNLTINISNVPENHIRAVADAALRSAEDGCALLIVVDLGDMDIRIGLNADVEAVEHDEQRHTMIVGATYVPTASEELKKRLGKD